MIKYIVTIGSRTTDITLTEDGGDVQNNARALRVAADKLGVAWEPGQPALVRRAD
jgi:hypothetical protein